MTEALGAAPFDGAAATYDVTFTETRLGRWLRDAVHARLAALFPPGCRVLELGSGTGEDAVWLAGRGVRVVATDASPRMVAVARQKAARAGVTDNVAACVLRIEDVAGAITPHNVIASEAKQSPALAADALDPYSAAVARGETASSSYRPPRSDSAAYDLSSQPVIASEAKQSPALAADALDPYSAAVARGETASSSYRPPRSDSATYDLSSQPVIASEAKQSPALVAYALQPASFDGALSNFGALNCVADLRPVAAALARLIRPGGHAALVIMGPWCPWEVLWHAAHGDLATAGRRFRRGGALAQIGGETLRVHYPSPRQMTAAFAPYFAPVGLRGVGVLLPPTNLGGLVERHPALFERLARWEARIAQTRVAGLLNDHYLIELRRTEP